MRVAKMPKAAACAAVMLACAAAMPAGTALAAPAVGCSNPDETTALSYAVAALATDEKSEPSDVHLKKDAYKVGEPFNLFLVPAGYACTQENGKYKANFSLSVQLIYRGDVAVDQTNVKTFDFVSAEKIKVIRIAFEDKISGLIPGAFAFKVTLTDMIGDRSAEVILPFTIAP